MTDEKNRELTLYVQSKKVITSFFRPSSVIAPGDNPAADVARPATRDPDASRAGEEAFFLSDDQARCVAMTEEVAMRRGYTVKVVDVAKTSRLERIVTERLRSVHNFPVLIGADDHRIEGVDGFTEERLCEFMPTEMGATRAFTYIKVRGGDLDRIRVVLLGLKEVKELHLLTGDWDVFVVLEFTGTTGGKRQVLDFVTGRIRGIPEVLDTSTLVPEYSVTKFPF
ncbi:MAG TPA: Lrp/AsnC ligand binding domain-containing protein [Thermoplasmata archaeon]|nr:Lrp/AsnC ligand binding domain-containing protein [Thermoplasmata archaeon]